MIDSPWQNILDGTQAQSSVAAEPFTPPEIPDPWRVHYLFDYVADENERRRKHFEEHVWPWEQMAGARLSEPPLLVCDRNGDVHEQKRKRETR